MNEEEPLATEMMKELKIIGREKTAIIILLIIVLVATNVYWIKKYTDYDYETNSEEMTEETIVDSEGDGMATYLENSESGDIINGKDN